MKSAYELAMERLEKEAPVPKLSAAQKEMLVEIEEKFKARIAEKELFLGDLISKAQATGDFSEVSELKTQLARELERLRGRSDSEKAKVRGEEV